MAVWFGTHHEQTAGNHTVVSKDRFVFMAFAQPQQALFYPLQEPLFPSDRQPRAALCAARADHCPATARFHTHKKPVGALATRFRRLVGPFHVSPPFA